MHTGSCCAVMQQSELARCRLRRSRSLYAITTSWHISLMLMSGAECVQKHLAGIVGLVAALVLETVLFITRASILPGYGAKYEALTDPAKYANKQQGPKPVVEEAWVSNPAGEALSAPPVPAPAVEAKKHR